MSFLLGLSLAACMQPIEIQVGGMDRTPAITVSPVELEFPVLSPGETAVEIVTITSAGNDRLVLDAPIISDGSFTLLTLIRDPILDPGESRTIEVVWIATDANVQAATITIASDDPQRPTVLVPVTGVLGVGELAFDHNHDFGILELGCEATATLTLESTGNAEVTLEDIWTEGGAYSLVEALDFPVVLGVGEALSLTVSFSPLTEGDASGLVVVQSDVGTASTALYGTAELPAAHTQSEEADPALPADLVFLVDGSCSMVDDLYGLREAFPHLVDELEGSGLDWRIGAVSHQDGCSTIDVLDSPIDADILEFAAKALTGGASSENLLSLASTALEQTVVGGCNEGLIRDNSLVHLVTASDEQDQSPLSWDVYVEEMQTRLGDNDRLRISAFVGSQATGYEQAVEATGGEVFTLSLADQAGHMIELGQASLSCGELTWIGLEGVADPDTVVVTRDGVNEPGWSLDAGDTVLSLDEPVQCGEVVEISYRDLPTCG